MTLILPPPLSQNVDIQAYSERLRTHASFIVAEQNSEIIGLTAFYKNIEAGQLYIPLICVDSCFQGHGIGGKMLSTLQRIGEGKYHTIALEVRKSNNAAYRFYNKHGFKEKEDRGEKLLMLKYI